MSPIPFRIETPDSALDDLHRRLAATRWPDEPDGAEWTYGANVAYLRELAAYWRTQFDWLVQQERLNRFAHFKTCVDGLDIHFIHERGRGLRPLPIVLTHGWPSTFFELHKLIPLLADPVAHGGDAADAFDVVVPSLPGFGFSGRPRNPGITSTTIAAMWRMLMTEVLGYERFVAHGGDIGAGVTTRLGLRHAGAVTAIHITAVATPYLGDGSRPLSAAERDYLESVRRWDEEEGAYAHIQATRPQTAAFGLNDSPVGLAAWIIEKFRAWGDCDGELERRFTKNELLTHVMIYWLTQTIGSSMRIYFAHRRSPRNMGPQDRVRVPTGVALTVEPVDRAPREWAERSYNVARWTEFPRGGHFMGMEEPELLAEDIRAFFRPFRS